jgi:hypothetical protein
LLGASRGVTPDVRDGPTSYEPFSKT